jgi:hypothetical protein
MDLTDLEGPSAGGGMNRAFLGLADHIRMSVKLGSNTDALQSTNIGIEYLR